MNRNLVLAALAAVSGLGASPVSALEALELYDNFNAASIDAKKWPNQTLRVREISGKKLHLVARDYAGSQTNTGTNGTSWSQNLPNPSVVTSLRATITVNRLQTIACSGNKAAAEARARIYLEPFNVGTPTPGSLINDVTAQLRVIRGSNSTDDADTLGVEGVVFQCLDASCSTTSTLGAVDLGTAVLGQAVTAQLEWDKANNRFLFRRDSGAKHSVGYKVSDKNAPGSPSALVGLRTTVPNCTASQRPSALVDATFDNVYVNSSALP